MLFYLILLFTIVPLLELWLLLTIGKIVGIIPTIGLVLFTGVLGAWLARREGLGIFKKLQTELSQARLPNNTLLDGVLVLIGAAFLLTPGLITDILGFTLLISPFRSLIRETLKKYFKKRIEEKILKKADIKFSINEAIDMGNLGNKNIEDVEYIEIEEDEEKEEEENL